MGPSKSADRCEWSQGLVGIAEVKPPTAEERARATITVKQLGQEFTTKYTTPRLKDPADYRAEAASVLNARICPRLGARPAAEVTALDVERLRDNLLDDKYAGASVIGTLACLSKLFVWGRRQRLIDCDNPCKGVERPVAASSLDYLSKLETSSLLDHAEQTAPRLWPLVAVGLYAGLRKGELMGLQWTAVHLDGAAPRIDVLRSYTSLPKSRKAWHVPLHPELARILRVWRDRHPAGDGNLVFPTERVKMGRGADDYGLRDLLAAAKCHVPAKPWHALRHTFASHFIMAGGNVLTLQKLLGHSDIKMTMVYAYLSPDHIAGEVARMSFAMPAAGVKLLQAAASP